MVARTEEAHRRLQRAIAERRVRREYLALVEGRPPARTGTIEAPIGRDPRVRTRMTVGGAGAREARTHFTLERALAGFSLLRVRLDTGRTHQIRVHLNAIGHPVCGDPEYGRPGLLGLERQFLHATRLAFEHPFSGEQIDLAVAPPRGPAATRWSAPKSYPERRIAKSSTRAVKDRGPARHGAQCAAPGSRDRRTETQPEHKGR